MEGNKCTAKSVAHISHLLILELILELDSEPVSLPLIVPANRVHADADYCLERSKNHLEEEEGNNGGRLSRNLLGKVEGLEERGCVKEGREKRKDCENMELGDCHHLGWVHVVPVAKFVR